MKQIRKGEIYLADLKQNIGNVQAGRRPVVIIQNNIGNKHSGTTIIACITSKNKKVNQPTHVFVKYVESDISIGQILTEQIITVNQSCLLKKIGSLNTESILRLNEAIKISLAL